MDKVAAMEQASKGAILNQDEEKLENALLVTCGRGGWTIYRKGVRDEQGVLTTGRRSGFDCKPILEKAINMGIPVVDSRSIPDDSITRYAFQGPLLAQHPSQVQEMKETGFNVRRVSPRDFVEFAKEWGASVYNENNAPDWRE